MYREVYRLCNFAQKFITSHLLFSSFYGIIKITIHKGEHSYVNEHTAKTD
nr:MAG TPA: hypothetical protein [Caudoviricetes sp.]